MTVTRLVVLTALVVQTWQLHCAGAFQLYRSSLSSAAWRIAVVEDAGIAHNSGQRSAFIPQQSLLQSGQNRNHRNVRRIGTELDALPAAVEGILASVTSSAEGVTTGLSSVASQVTRPLAGGMTKLTEVEESIVSMEKSVVSSAASDALEAIQSFTAKFELPPASSLSEGGKVAELLEEISSALTSAVSAVDGLVMANDPIAPIYQSLKGILSDTLGPSLAGLPTPVSVIVTALGTYVIASSLLSAGKPPPPGSPYPMGKYDAVSARAYFDTKPVEALSRATEITVQSTKFLLGILSDFLGDKLQSNSEVRAMELCDLLTTLGPSFIKIGQSLSIRSDILSPAYQRGLKSLQDNVPAFDTVVARQMIEEELGLPVEEIFSNFSPEPVAAASLGQVYRGTLRSDGREVAVKVQRPNIMNQIALDMHLIREVGDPIKSAFNLNTDIAGLVDAWGLGFVDELDYRQEADNAKIFIENLKNTPLSEVVLAPEVVDQYTSGKVLVTEWVDGERLDRSAQEDVTVLCSIAMNTYLTMMLETGVLHCDPHPGNLLRTPDGKLCILDWGMVTRVSPELQVTLIEHMAHLTSADYAEIPNDLLVLGFISEEKADEINDSGVVETLADIYGAWSQGGGAATIDVKKVVTQLQDLAAEKGNLFRIPSYFAYIAKSFSVLEGIGLSNDPNYSIINECLPYVSKRLMTDENPRMGGALSTFVFGPSKSNPDRIVDYDRVEQLITGFGDYTSSASGELINRSLSKTERIEAQADQILDLLLTTDDETPLQSIFLEQLAKIISSSSRSIWSELREASGTLPSGRSVLGTMVDPLGLWRTSPLIRVSDLDGKTIETTRNLITLFQEQSQKSPLYDVSAMSNEEVLEVSRILVSKVWDKRYGLVQTGGKLARLLLEMTADKLEKGERDVTVLPTTTSKDDEESEQQVQEHSAPRETVAASSPTRSETRVRQSASAPPASKRLEEARRLLASLEEQDKSDYQMDDGTTIPSAQQAVTDGSDVVY